MGKKKYVAYVGTYTHGTSKGIQVYDVDVENGTLTERSEVEVSNASHLAVSKNGKYLYSIEDEGVAVFERDENGDLSRINSVDINGMRGCYLATDVDGRYLYVAGYHDGKVTVVHTHKDGRLGSVMDGVFHKGLGSVAERNFRPHVNCVRPTPDNKYLCAVDNGIDQVKIYRINKKKDKLELVDILRYASIAADIDLDSLMTATLPGEARDEDGKSYFFLDKKGCQEMMAKIFNPLETPESLDSTGSDGASK